MTNFSSQVIFGDEQKGVGASGSWVCCTQPAHAITENLSQLDQVLGRCRASKSKKSNIHLSSKNEKNPFLQSIKIDGSQQHGEIWGPNLRYRYLTKMHCS